MKSCKLKTERLQDCQIQIASALHCLAPIPLHPTVDSVLCCAWLSCDLANRSKVLPLLSRTSRSQKKIGCDELNILAQAFIGAHTGPCTMSKQRKFSAKMQRDFSHKSYGTADMYSSPWRTLASSQALHTSWRFSCQPANLRNCKRLASTGPKWLGISLGPRSTAQMTSGWAHWGWFLT